MEYDSYVNQLEHGNIAERAAAVAMRYGQIDGDHHKTWVIDQMIRILAGDGYREFVRIHEEGGYEWDTGIAP